MLAPHLYNTSYDVMKDFEPVALITEVPVLFAISAGSPAKTLADFVAIVRAQHGKLNYGSGGNATPAHLGADLLKSLANFDTVHVPYRGTPQALAALMAGDVALFLSGPAAVISQEQAGKIKLIAVSTKQRIRAAAHVPTTAEAGYPDLTVPAWYGIYAPKGTPRPVINALAAGIKKTLDNKAIRDKFDAASYFVINEGPEALDKLTKADFERWGAVIRKAGIKGYQGRKATARDDFGPAVLAVRVYGCAPRPELDPLATLFDSLATTPKLLRGPHSRHHAARRDFKVIDRDRHADAQGIGRLRIDAVDPHNQARPGFELDHRHGIGQIIGHAGVERPVAHGPAAHHALPRRRRPLPLARVAVRTMGPRHVPPAAAGAAALEVQLPCGAVLVEGGMQPIGARTHGRVLRFGLAHAALRRMPIAPSPRCPQPVTTPISQSGTCRSARWRNCRTASVM